MSVLTVCFCSVMAALHVDFMCYWLKMSGVNTGSISAFMVKFFSSRNWPDKNLVGDYVRFADAKISWAVARDTISQFMAMARPLPALCIFIDDNLHQKACTQRRAIF